MEWFSARRGTSLDIWFDSDSNENRERTSTLSSVLEHKDIRRAGLQRSEMETQPASTAHHSGP